MAQRDRSPNLDHLSDAWSEAWGDPALQELGRRLTAAGLSDERAATAVEQVWLFYSYEALPALGVRLPMGIAYGFPVAHLRVFLYFPSFTDGSDGNEERFAPLGLSSQTAFTVPVSETISFGIERIPAPFPMLHSRRWVSETFPERVRSDARRRQLDFVGVFLDDLVSELRTVMDTDDVPTWLNTPNSFFGGGTPGEFLDDPLDRRMRDIITRAKFNLPAA